MADTTSNYIHWNIINWITVVVMVAVGMALVGMVASFVRQGLPTIGAANE